MSADDLAVVLAVIGGACLVAAHLARSSGAAARDAWLLFGAGAGLLACMGALAIA